MITLHHLNQSRSKRIIWLLEELGVDYQICAYKRDAVTFLAPPECTHWGNLRWWKMTIW